LSGSADFTIPGGSTYRWTGGTMFSSGGKTIVSGGSLLIDTTASGVNLNVRAINMNSGTMSWTSGTLPLTLLQGGTINLNGAFNVAVASQLLPQKVAGGLRHGDPPTPG